MRNIVFTFLLLLTITPAYAQEIAVPPLKARVTDLTNTLTEPQRRDIENTLKAFESAKGSQIAVLLVPTTKPEAIEQYSIRVVDIWKLGRKGVADGVLVLIAKNDRKLRIEVGRGLEGAIPDAIAKRITREIMVPKLKEGDYFGSVKAGVGKIIGVIGGEKLPPPPRKKVQTEDWTIFGIIALIGLSIVVSILRNIMRGGGYGGPGGGYYGGGWGGGGGSSSGGDSFSGGGGDFGGGGASDDY